MPETPNSTPPEDLSRKPRIVFEGELIEPHVPDLEVRNVPDHIKHEGRVGSPPLFDDNRRRMEPVRRSIPLVTEGVAETDQRKLN